MRLASNESPYPPLPAGAEAIERALSTLNRYPDPSNSLLRARLSDRYGVPASRIAIGNGSCDILLAAGEALLEPGAELVYAWPSFSVYPHLGAASGARALTVPLDSSDRHDLEAMLREITVATRLVLVCNPNNPTSTAVHRDELVGFLSAVPEDVVVVVDEAYHEFVTDARVPDALTLLDDYPNLIVLRTFSKAYGLAGLRVGYGISGNTEVPAALRQTQSPFAVTALAQQAALASLEPEAESQLMARVKDVVIERERVTAELVAMGYDVPPTQANFVWVPMGADTMAWADGCAQRKVIVRPFDGFGSRVTIGTPGENDTFLAAARQLAPALN